MPASLFPLVSLLSLCAALERLAETAIANPPSPFAGVYLRMHAVAVLYAKVLLCVEDLFHSTEMGILAKEPANYAALTCEVTQQFRPLACNESDGEID
jgi:hypothetical protein